MPVFLAESAFDFSTLDLSSIMPTFTAALGIALPVVVGIFAARKGLSWALGAIRRA